MIYKECECEHDKKIFPNDSLDYPQSECFQKISRLFMLSTNQQVLPLHHFHKQKLQRLTIPKKPKH